MRVEKPQTSLHICKFSSEPSLLETILLATVKKKTFTPNLVEDQLPLILVKPFNSFKSYVLFGCIMENNYNING